MILSPSTSHSLNSPLPPFTFSNNPPSPPPSTLRFHRPASITASANNTKSFNTCLPSPNLASSFYQILGISMSASCQEIKSAYRTLARNCHPDTVTVSQKESSANEFMKIHTAYSTLSDPAKRAEYDRRIFRLHRSYASVVSRATEPVFPQFSNAYTCRNWETDQCW